jgi:hypothetical protein
MTFELAKLASCRLKTSHISVFYDLEHTFFGIHREREIVREIWRLKNVGYELRFS